MEVVQTGPLVCASRPTSSSHPAPRLLAHRIDGDPTSALHVQTEEGGGGVDPSWWKISASGSWDGGERRMRYGKLIDDRPGEIPGAVQRRKLEMLETHAPGASMRVVHSQSTASWVQDSGGMNCTGLNSSMSNSRRSVLASSSSSTRVTSFRQWSSNFNQNSTNSVGIKHETRPSIAEFGNLELALNPLDVSFLRTRGNVGRSGSIGARRPPSRGRRFSSDNPLGSPVADDHSNTPSPTPRTDSSGSRIHDIALEDRGEENFEESKSEWPPVASPTDEDDPSRFARSLQMALHRKRSVSSEDVRAAEENEEEEESSADDQEGKWRRGAAVRRSLPSSEWRSIVGAVDGARQRLRPRDPPKSYSVPALGGASSLPRRGSFVTAESLREMKGKLRHRSETSDAQARPKAIEAPPNDVEMATGSKEPSTPRSSPFLLRATAREGASVARLPQDGRDDRRKSWSVGCRGFAKRGVEDDEGTSNRRRSYAFEHSVEENGSSENRENLAAVGQMQEGRGDVQRGKMRVDPQPYLQSRVNEVLKKWSALSKEEEGEEKENLKKASDLTPMVIQRGFGDGRGESPVRNSTTWLEHSEYQENSAGVEVSEFSPATMTSGGRTTLRVIHSKGPQYNDEILADVCVQEKVTPESSFSVSGETMDDYMSTHGLAPIDWTDNDSKASKETVKNDTATTSTGISVIFSNTDGDNNVRHHYSVTHLDNRNGDGSKTEAQGFKIRTSKKVEFSKTEVHFAAESGRFHIVETAGKPPPSNNFRRRRRSPTGVMNVDTMGRLGAGAGSQSAITNGMRFGDSPYEMRLLAGTDGLEHSSRRNEDDYANEQGPADEHLSEGEGLLDYKALPNGKTKLFNEIVIEEERETKEVQKTIAENDVATSSSTFLHLGLDDPSVEKPRSILRSVTAANSPPWKSAQKDVEDVQNEEFKPKFGGVRLRPVVSSATHSRINVASPEPPDLISSTSSDSAHIDALSPGQMELQKLLRSLRHVSMTYNDNPPDPSTTGVQVANGGGMEVRISSGSQAAVSNTVIIGNESTEIPTPLSVAQRVREVEERRQKELSGRVAGNQRTATRAGGHFSTRVTLGSGSSSVVSLESQVPRKTLVSQIESVKPVSPKPAAKLSTHSNKSARIHNTQDKVGQLRVVRKGIREGIRRQERTQIRTTSEERALKPEATAITSIGPFLGGWDPLSPALNRVAQPLPRREDSKKTTPEDAEGLWKGNLHPTPSASWPSARGFGRVGDDRVMLKSPSLILQTMLATAFSTTTNDESASKVVEVWKEIEVTVEIDKVDRIVTEKQDDTLMSGDKLQPKLSILRALYRDASEEEGSDAAGDDGDVGMSSLDGLGEGGVGGARAGDGGSVVSGSWRRLRRSKQPIKRLPEEVSGPSIATPKPVPRRQAGQPVVRANERAGEREPPPLPPPRTRNYAQRVKRRGDGRGGGRERVQERRKGGECGGKGVASGLAGDSLQHSQVATTSDIKISARVTENHTKLEHSKDVPMVTCIALGFQDKAKDGMRNAESKPEAKVGGAGHSTLSGVKIDAHLGEQPKRITSKVGEHKLEPREKSPEEAIHSTQGKYIPPSSKQVISGWRSIDAKSKKDDDVAKSDLTAKCIRSQRRVKEIASSVEEKSLAKASFTSLNSPTAENNNFPSDVTNFETFKEGTRMDDVTGTFSIKMKVIKSQAEEEKSSVVQGPSLQGHTKATNQYDYLQHRRTNINTLNTASKLSESEVSAQKSRKEGSFRTDSKTSGAQALKSPTMDHRQRLQAGSPRSGNPETSSPSSGRVVRKRLRKGGSGAGAKVPSSSEKRREGADDDSSILEELTKAADEILHAVNGYSDEGSSEEDTEALKNESRSKRRSATRKESASRKLSSSSARDSKGGGSQRNTGQKARARAASGTVAPSAEGTLPEAPRIAAPESQRTSRGMSAGSPTASPISGSHGRGGMASLVSEKSQRSKQQQPPTKKGMTRIEPTNRVPEVKLIEKRPPLPPVGQRRTAGLKERSEAPARGIHGKTKTTTSLVYNKDGEAEPIKEAKRPINIARALEAVMPDSRTKTRKIEQKIETTSISKISEAPMKNGPSSSSASAQPPPGSSHSFERKKISSSHDGDKTTRRRVHQNITSPT